MGHYSKAKSTKLSYAEKLVHKRLLASRVLKGNALHYFLYEYFILTWWISITVSVTAM